MDLEHLLDWQVPPLSATEVAAQVASYLAHLVTSAATGDELDQKASAQIAQTFRHRWWGLFTCYRVAGMPRTNNDLETFLRHLKCGQRRITGRKNVHDFVVRYGRFAAFLDDHESQASLLRRLCQVNYADFVQERKSLSAIQAQVAQRHRFRHRRAIFLRQLETDWAAALTTLPVAP